MQSVKTLFATSLIAATVFAGQAFAADITVTNPWARGSAGMAKAGAAFMQIKNDGADDTLVAAKADVSKKVELHTHSMIDGVMKMREVEGGIPVPGGQTQELKPGSYHVMFMGLHAPLKEGSSFPVTLVFKNGGEQTITVDVQSPKSMGGMNHGTMNHGGHNMGGMKK